MTDERQPRSVVKAFVDATAHGDVQASRTLRTDSFVERWPQSGERVRGRQAIEAIEETYPGGRPEVAAIRRIQGHDDFGVTELLMRYPDGSDWWTVQVIRLAGERVDAVTTDFGQPFPPPGWRARWVERFDPTAPPVGLPHEHRTEGPDPRSIIARYLDAGRRRDRNELARHRHPDWVSEYPQSGERIPSHAADAAIHQAYPGHPDQAFAPVVGEADRWTLSPMLTPVRVAGAGNLWVGSGVNQYPSRERYVVFVVMEFAGPLARRETAFWTRPFAAPEWRAHLVERYDPLKEA